MNRHPIWELTLLVLLLAAPVAAAEVSLGEVVYQTDFERADALRAWGAARDPNVRLVPGHGGSQSLLIERPAQQGAGARTIRAALPLEKLRGTRVKIEVLVKAENVAQPPKPHNGVKCTLHVVSPGGSRWPQLNNIFGTFDFQPHRFLAEIPADAIEASLVLGLEATTGKVWFDDLKITVVGVRRRAAAVPTSQAAYKGHDLPRLRGTMIGPRVTADDLRTLGAEWKANHIRWQLIWGGFPRSPADNGDLPAYDAWLETALGHLDRLLPVCEEVGLKVLVDLHTPPGGRNQSNECRLFKEKRFQEAFLQVWDKIARRYRGNKTVWGFDLVNEPVEGVMEEGLMDWHSLAAQTAKSVRAMDPEHAIIVEPAPWGNPQALDFFEPLDVPGVVYSVHMYLPHSFTHQGVRGSPTGINYPGLVDGKQVGQQQLREALRPAIDYQRDYHVHMYIGEFSAIRWAPGESAYNYLHDVIDIFEHNGWDWAYHAFREWDGWSVEHGPDPQDHSRSKTPTDREQLLRLWFARNTKPASGRKAE